MSIGSFCRLLKEACSLTREVREPKPAARQSRAAVSCRPMWGQQTYSRAGERCFVAWIRKYTSKDVFDPSSMTYSSSEAR